MAEVVVTLKIMPEGLEVDLDELEQQAAEMIANFGAELGKVEVEPIAFGLKALKMVFVMDEEKGSTEALEKEISKVGGVNSVEVTDVRRAIG